MEIAIRTFITSARGYVHKTFHLDRTAIFSGLRVIVVTVLPILVGIFLQRPDLGIMGFLSGLYAVLADVGGAYRIRAFAMCVATLGISLAAFVATLIGGNVWLAVPLMFLCSFACSLLGSYGNIGTKIGFVIIGIFIIVMGMPAGLTMACERWISFMIGGAWAMLLTLWLWPWQPFQPVRNALATYYRALSDFISQACDMDKAFNEKDSVHWNETVRAERARIMSAQDEAHNVLIASRSRREEGSALSRRFLLVTLNADRLFDEAIALAESIEVALLHTQDAKIKALLAESVQQIASMLMRLASRIESGDDVDETLLNQQLEELAGLEETSRQELLRLLSDPVVLTSIRNVLRLQAHVVKEMASAFEHVRELRTGKRHIHRINTDQRHTQQNRSHRVQDFLRAMHNRVDLLLNNLTPRSLIFRHALRLSVSTALTVAFYIPLKIHNGYWIPLTVLFILKPDYGGTLQRSYQRILGTILGGALATILVSTIHNELLLIVLLCVIGFFAFAHLTGDYGIFVVFLTLFVVVMLDISSHSNWVIGLIRIENTVLGGIVALLFGYLFWPQWEQERLPSQLSRTIMANREYFHCVMSAYLGETSNLDALHQASRRAHLENSNAAAAFQRLLSEPKTRRGDVERFYALVTYNQHFCDHTTALAIHLRTSGQRHNLPGLTRFAEQTEKVLCNLQTAVSLDTPPSEMATLEESLKYVQSSFESLLNERQIKGSPQPRVDTAQQETVRAASFVESQLNRLANDVAEMVRI